MNSKKSGISLVFWSGSRRMLHSSTTSLKWIICDVLTGILCFIQTLFTSKMLLAFCKLLMRIFWWWVPVCSDISLELWVGFSNVKFVSCRVLISSPFFSSRLLNLNILPALPLGSTLFRWQAVTKFVWTKERQIHPQMSFTKTGMYL